MKKSEIRLMFVIIIAISIVAVATSLITYIIFLTKWPEGLSGGYERAVPNVVACTFFCLLAFVLLIGFCFIAFIKNQKIKNILTYLCLSLILASNLIACCVAKYTNNARLQYENLTIILSSAISVAILVFAIFGILILNHLEKKTESKIEN